MESKFSKAGYVDTTATDGRALRVIFPYNDPARTQQLVQDTVTVLSEFASVCTAGGPDVDKVKPNALAMPCDVILAFAAGLHQSQSDNRVHTSIQATSNANWNQNPRVTMSGYHVYAKNNDISQGYNGWYSTPNANKSKLTSDKIKDAVAAALQNDMTA